MSNAMKQLLVRRFLTPVALLSLALGLSGCTKTTEAVEPPPPKVTIAHPVMRELTDYEEYNGWTAPSETVDVRSRVRGHIIKVDFTDGEIVPKDKLLFQLDPQPFEAETGRAEGQLGIAVAQRDQAVIEEQRIKRIYERNAATIQEYEQAQAAAKSMEAQVKAATDEVTRRKLDETFAKIKAPIEGKISRAMLTEGNLVSVGTADPVLTTIVDIDPIHVYFNVDERTLAEYRERRTASKAPLKPLEQAEIPFDFRMESEKGFPHHGILNFADNRIDPDTGSIEIRGKADNADHRFLPGGRVRVRVAVSEPYQGVLVPDTAVLSDQEKKYLLCLNDENVVIRKDVNLGKLLDDGMRVILPADGETEGLTTKDRVIVVGLQRARINYPVEPMDEEGKAVEKSN
jgi:multidrug efflux system membrane fusion protein